MRIDAVADNKVKRRVSLRHAVSNDLDIRPLMEASSDEIDTWVDGNVTSVVDIKATLKWILKHLALEYKEG